MESTQSAPMESDAPAPVPMRVFEVVYVDGSKGTFAANFYDAAHGPLIFIDRVFTPDAPADQRYTLWHRRTIAAGQWRQITEITGTTQSTETH